MDYEKSAETTGKFELGGKEQVILRSGFYNIGIHLSLTRRFDHEDNRP